MRTRTRLARLLIVFTVCASLSTPAIAAPAVKAGVGVAVPGVDARVGVDVAAGRTGERESAAAPSDEPKAADTGAAVDADARVAVDASAAGDAKPACVEGAANADLDVRIDRDGKERKKPRPVGPWMWAGLGIAAGGTIALFGASMGALGKLKGSVHDKLVLEAKASQVDADLNNDIDPSGDICGQARASSAGGERNPGIAGLCDGADVKRRVAIGTGITAGVLVTSVIALAVAIGVRRKRGREFDELPRPRCDMGFTSLRGGGMLTAQIRF